MDFPLPFFPTSIIASILIASLLLSYSLLRRNTSKKQRLLPPEAAGARPFIGHLHLLGGLKPPHITLANMADKYGPIFAIKIGMHTNLVVSSWEMAKECLTTNDKAFASRPKAVAMELLGYNYAMLGFSPYGPYWRQVRKIITLELLSNHRLEILKHVRIAEIKSSTKELRNRSSDIDLVVDIKRWFWDTTRNVIFKLVVGKRYTEDGADSERCREALKEFFELAEKYVVSDWIPFSFLRWFDFGGHEKAMKKTAKELDHVVEGWLKEHKQKRGSGEVKGELDFMNIMISILDDAQELPTHDANTICKATCLGLVLAASDTTAVSLTWAMSLLLNNRDVLKRAQHELDNQVGKERQVNESDINNLVYLQAIVKESLRLHPAAPLSVPHESMEDCTIGGYDVPAGTRLLVNLWKIHRDPRVWSDPDKFQPERFLNVHKDFDVWGQNFEFLPFGSGRRMCPGVSFALQILHLTLATLIHGFEIATPLDEAVDLNECIGKTSDRVTPLQVLLTPRLPDNLYG